jgi:hypothetical protein
MTTIAESQTLFVGWYRPDARSPWQAIVEDADERRCFQRLLDARSHGDFLVRSAERGDPNADKRPR